MYKKVEITTLTILFVFLIYCTLITASFWDANYEMSLGKDRLKYLLSFGAYKNFDFHIYTRFYPGFYNTLAIFVTKMFPIKFENEVWRLTHVFFSIFTIVGVYKITSILFNKKIGKIVFLLCFFNPIFFGHMIMNSKDTIVAFAHVWSTYIFLRYLANQSIKAKRIRYIFLAGLSIGLGMGVRFPFLISLTPLFCFVLIDNFFTKKILNKDFSFNKFLFDLIKIFFISYFVAISFWPQAHVNIITEPFKLLLEQITMHGGGVPWILFQGEVFSTNDLPNSYIITNLIFKTPEFLLLSYLFFIFFIFSNHKYSFSSINFFWCKILLLLLILFFPIILFTFLPYRVYDGLRLFLYILPYFCIIPGVAIYYLKKNFYSKIIRALSLVLAFFIIYYIYIFILLTPYQYTYLNKILGNFSNAHTKFENDYLAISIKDLIKKVSKSKILTSKEQKIKIAFCGVNHVTVMKELNKIKNLDYNVTDLDKNDFDYVIMTKRAQGKNNSNLIKDVKSCFKKVEGLDLIKIERNGLMLSTLRKKL